MGMDLVVALGQAALGGRTLFGLNVHGSQGTARPILVGLPGNPQPFGQDVRTDSLVLPQGRDCWGLVGGRPRDLHWGLTHGCNEQGVVMGRAGWKSRLLPAEEALLGTDLVRLVLERSHTAQQAVEVLTDLIGRHGQKYSARQGAVFTDNVFLIADGSEAILVEAAGRHWALLECRRSRAVADAALIRQDWQKVAHDFAPEAVRAGWWKDDGNKLDFGGLLGEGCPVQTWALQRWGRATLLLEQQDGKLDLDGLRLLLDELFEHAADRYPGTLPRERLGSFLAAVDHDHPAVPIAWPSVDIAGFEVHFPVLPGGILPEPMVERLAATPRFVVAAPDSPAADTLQDRLLRWQTRLESALAEALPPARRAHADGDREAYVRLATNFMRHQWQELEDFLHPERQRTHLQTSLRDEIAYVAE